MKKYYICRDFKDACGISKYGYTFYNSVLREHNYEAIHLKSEKDINRLIKNIKLNDKIWIEIGLASILEVSFLKILIKKGNKNTVVTVHDAPFLEYPVFKFTSRIGNILSKIFQVAFLRWPLTRLFYNYLNKIKTIYTLNPKGKVTLEKRYNLSNVKSIEHVLTNVITIDEKIDSLPQLLYFGFIGKNKGLEYALRLHKKVNEKLATPISVKVIGKTLDQKSENYLNSIKKEYTENVDYLGFLPDDDLDSLMKQENIVLLPTKNYKVICPTSGSVLNSLKYLNIVFTTRANSNEYVIKDNINGFFLQGDIDKDSQKIIKVIKDHKFRYSIQKEIYKDLVEKYSPTSIITGINSDDYK